jgi:hypothetical protein
MMKSLIAVLAITAASIVPAHADTLPDLKKYVCIDQRGIHHSWRAAFDGTTFCKLTLNRFSK